MKRIFLFVTIIIVALHENVYSQNNRLNTKESIGWYNFFTTTKLNEKFGLHAEYQWRREKIITNWQQSLLRVGINYQPNARVLVRVGYAWIETFPYGEIPINGFGRDFTEHRIFEMIQFSHKESLLDFSHRFMLEQRFVGRYSAAGIAREDEFPLLNRMRYMLRLQAPLLGKEIKDRTPYLAAYDEVFIGFGKNVTANIFDQNRVGILLGYRLNKDLRIEAGYLNQTVQFGRLVNGKNVFQYNNGIIVNTNLNVSFMKRK